VGPLRPDEVFEIEDHSNWRCLTRRYLETLSALN
jgi:hypothetical protein